MRPADVVVVNLVRRPDRLAAFLRRWDDLGTGVPVQVWPAVDTGTAAGCLASHLQVLSSFPGPLLVLEDDAVFRSGFTLDLEPPPDWDVLWLGGRHLAPPMHGPPPWVRVVAMAHTHAYVARDPAALARTARNRVIPRADPHLSRIGIAYAHTGLPVGQAAGAGDLADPPRPTDQYWS